jgi:protein-S-isoprenylcysteine O-methyltransferase Ste14
MKESEAQRVGKIMGTDVTESSLAPDRRHPTTDSKTLAKTTILSLSYLGLAVICLIQWRTDSTWSRIDLFSGGYLALRMAGTIHSIFSSRKAFRSTDLRKEWWGTTSNPGGIWWVILLMLADLAVFWDYGHWHTLASLERPLLQSLGLGLYGCTIIWQAWTDTCLANYFARQESSREPITSGPFRRIRHPRYAGAIAGKIAFALVFASLLGWMLALAWLLYLVRNVTREEAHLKNIFGAKYELYARKTARLLPGVY